MSSSRKIASTSREDGTERADDEGELTVVGGWRAMGPSADGTHALLWLELAEGATRQVLVERLAQANLTDPHIETDPGDAGWNRAFEDS